MHKPEKAPHSAETERAVLAVVLNAPDTKSAMIAAQHITSPLMFFVNKHQIAWLAVLALLAKDVNPDVVAVADTLSKWGAIHAKRVLEENNGAIPQDGIKGPDAGAADALDTVGGFAAISELAGGLCVPSAIARNAELVADAWRKREAMRVVERAKATLRGDGLSGDAIGRIVSELQALSQGTHAGQMTMAQAIDSALADGDKRRDLRKSGARLEALWGVVTIDQALPLEPATVTTLTGPSGGGKTVLAMQAACETWRQGATGSVLYVSLEMTAEQLSARAAAAEIGVNPKGILQGTLLNAQRAEVAALSAEWAQRGSMILRDCSAGRLTAQAIADEAKRVHAERGLALLVIDHLHLIPSPARMSRFDALCEATALFKRMAVSLRCPVLLLCQMNRDGSKARRNQAGKIVGNPEPTLGDLKGSGSIENDSDNVVMLHAPELSEPDLITACIRKNRAGTMGEVPLMFDRPRSRFMPRMIDCVANRPGYHDRMAAPPDPSEDFL